MRLILIYFRETPLEETNKFTLDFSDQGHVQPIDFLSKETYYIATLNCKLKIKEYIHEDGKVKKLSEKSSLLHEKGPSYLYNIDNVVLKSAWYIKPTDKFILNSENSYKYKFWDRKEKKIRDCKIYLPYSQLLAKGFNFERKEIKGMNLIVRLNEEQSLLESFLLHRSPKSGTEYLNIFLGKAYYRDINLLYACDKQNKQWFTSGPEFFNEAICEKVKNKNFNLKAFALQYYHVEKKRKWLCS